VTGLLIEGVVDAEELSAECERPEDRPPPDDPGTPPGELSLRSAQHATHAFDHRQRRAVARKWPAEAKLALRRHVLRRTVRPVRPTSW